MKLNLQAAFLFTLLTIVQSSSAKIYYGESAEKIKKKGYAFTLKQIDSSDDFNVLNSQQVGVAQRIHQYFSASGKYLAVYLTRKKKQTDELIVYSTSDFKEVLRKDVGKIPSYYLGATIKPFFNQDESIITLQVMKSKKEHTVNAYSLEDGSFLYSHPLEKKSHLMGQSNNNDALYIGGKPSLKGYSSIEIIDIQSGEVLNKYANKKTKYIYKELIHSNLFVAINPNLRSRSRSRPSTSSNPNSISISNNYEIILLDGKGKSILRNNVGEIAPVFTTSNDGKDIYFVSKSKKGKWLEINHLLDDKINLITHSEIFLEPSSLIVSNQASRFLVAGKGDFLLLDSDTNRQPKKIGRPFDIATGFFSSDDSLVYLREGTGSEVGVVGFEQQKIINTSGVGRKSVKFGQFMATVALGAATGFYTGYIGISYRYSDTAMLLSRNEERLYVVNSKTNDVTLFNAKDLAGRKGVATGNGTFGVFQLNDNYYPEDKDGNVFVMSPNSISYFNTSSLEAIKKVEFDSFINFDAEENVLFTKDKENNINIYQLNTGNKLAFIDKVESINQLNYYISSE